ncbi:MAG: cob(I)yrinic acid a,c-diamide adenosyltransferase [Kiritimatiellia bacterium]
MERGYVHVYTGKGKGKTTAALGLLLRACGAGLRVYLGQFLKGQKSGEIEVLRERFPEVTVEQYGSPQFVRRPPHAEDLERARSGIRKIEEAMRSGKYDLVIADEIVTALKLGVLTEEMLLHLIAVRPKEVELVLTGRGASRVIRSAADLVTEMRSVKHYYANGVQARRGIEW